ncbi:MAG: homoserine kinase [Bacteroidales bacterium]|nr:homoserine kinase [Bacteroidales bacterium]
MESLKIFVPATVSNVTCGFDILGFPVEAPGDIMTFRKTENKEIRITRISGADNIPLDTNQNIAGIVSHKMLEDNGMPFGLEIELDKGIVPGSGIGSSGASAAGTAFAVNILLKKKYTERELIPYAMLGEMSASGTRHADNVAPAIYGGFVLIRSYDPLDIIRLDYPEDLYCTVFHPLVEIRTRDARDILKKTLALDAAIQQWGNVAGLVTGLLKKDYDLIARSMKDVVAEPVRSLLIPGYHKLKNAAMENGALGCGISGSGPSVFALMRGAKVAAKVKTAMTQAYQDTEINFNAYFSKIATQGVKIIS